MVSTLKETKMTEAAHDYLAFILIGAGSSYGRSPRKEEAIKTAIQSLGDWRHLFKVDDVDVTINVVDVNGYDTVLWGPDGIFGVPEGQPHTKHERVVAPIEKVTRHTPKRRKR